MQHRQQTTRSAARRRAPWIVAAIVALVGSTLVAGPAMAAFSKSPPSGLKASDTSNTSIVLTWNRIKGINRYAIQYSTSSKFSNPQYAVPTGVTNKDKAFRSINGLKPATTYYFRIRGTTDGGKNVSDWSKSYKRKTSTYVYGAPSAPKSSNPRSDSVTLSWGETPNAGRYRVRYTPKSGAGAGTYQYAEPISNGVTLTGLRKNQAYKVQVRALEGKADDNGDLYLLTGYSKEGSFTTTAFTTGPAGGLAVTSAKKDAIALEWDKVEGADAYRVQYWTSSKDTRYITSNTMPTAAPGSSFDTSGDKVKATLTRFCLQNSCPKFTPGKKYFFRVTALKGSTRINDYTASSGVSVVASSYNLSYPMHLKVESTTNNSITISWPKVPGAAGYYIQHKEGSEKGRTGYTGVTGPEVDGRLTATVSKFSNGDSVKGNTSYYLRIVSTKAGGTRDSEYHPSYTKATTARYKYAAPVMGGTNSKPYEIDVTWSERSGAPAYAIQRSKDAEFKKIDGTTCVLRSKATVLPPNGSSTQQLQTTVKNLSGEQSYFFRTRAVSSCSSGYSTQSYDSAPVSARTQARVGAIAGKVVRAEGDVLAYNAAVKSMVATAYAGSCASSGYDVASTTHVNDDGTWKIEGLRGGDYCLLLSQVGDANFTSSWYRGYSAVYDSEYRKLKFKASTVKVSGTGTTTVEDVRIGPGQQVTGTVKRADGSQAGLAKAVVTLTAAPQDPKDTRREVRAVAITDENGKYSFTGLFPGKYRVDVVKSGYGSFSVWVDHIEKNPIIDLRLCGTSSCKPSSSTIKK